MWKWVNYYVHKGMRARMCNKCVHVMAIACNDRSNAEIPAQDFGAIDVDVSRRHHDVTWSWLTWILALDASILKFVTVALARAEVRLFKEYNQPLNSET